MTQWKTYSTAVDVEIDIDTMIEHFGEWVVLDRLVEYHCGPEGVLGYLGSPEPGLVEYDLSDPVVRLGLIVALRNCGYSVEPA